VNTLVSLLATAVAFVAACAAVCFAWHQTERRHTAEGRLREAERRLNTYRQWADGHIYLAFPEPHEQEGGTPGA
jgi:hypothetical protein